MSRLRLPSFEIAPEDEPDRSASVLVDGDLAILGVVAERHHAADPQSLALGGGDLVADTLGGDLPLELGKGQQHVERQPAHRGGRVELLGDGDKGDIMVSNSSTSLAKSASERVRRSTL